MSKLELILSCGHAHSWPASVETNNAPAYDRDLIDGPIACYLCGEGYQLDTVEIGKGGKPELKVEQKKEPVPDTDE